MSYERLRFFGMAAVCVFGTVFCGPEHEFLAEKNGDRKAWMYVNSNWDKHLGNNLDVGWRDDIQLTQRRCDHIFKKIVIARRRQMTKLSMTRDGRVSGAWYGHAVEVEYR
jgi:hypothetical protein